MLPIGTPAPDFKLSCIRGHSYTLQQFREKRHVVLAFLPSVATKVNQNQMQLYQELVHLLPDFQATLMGICIDPVCLGNEFIRRLSYPILSDDAPLGKVGCQYQAFDQVQERMSRTMVVIDKSGKIVLYHQAKEEEVVGADVIFTTLAQLAP